MDDVKDYPPYLDYPKERKKQTNGDKIRHMSDEELAEFLSCIYTLETDDYGDFDQCTMINGHKFRATEEMLDWLKQEVRDGDA